MSKKTIISKSKLVELISKKVKLSKSQIDEVLTNFLEQVKSSLVKGEEIRFPSYFSLKTATQAARVAMNLQTKKKMNIPAKRVPKVRFSDDLKIAIAKKK